jgi:hypothetical protein
LKDTLQVLDLGSNLVFAEGSNINTALGQLTKLTDLRYDSTNFANGDQGIPTEINNLKALEFYNCASTLYRGPLSNELFPADMTALSKYSVLSSHYSTPFRYRHLIICVCTDYLDIEFNAYNSTIPSSIGNLPNLERFYARDSFIQGDLEFMRNMKSIGKYFIEHIMML